jgi:hypothetical protein
MQCNSGADDDGVVGGQVPYLIRPVKLPMAVRCHPIRSIAVCLPPLAALHAGIRHPSLPARAPDLPCRCRCGSRRVHAVAHQRRASSYVLIIALLFWRPRIISRPARFTSRHSSVRRDRPSLISS